MTSLLDGRIRLLSLAGQGAAGEVHRGVDQANGRPLAVKILKGMLDDDRAAERFQREIDVLRAIESPHVVRYVSQGTDPSGAPFVAVEWLEGEDLARRLQRGPLDWSEAIEVARQAARGLAALHAIGVVHRDVKPGNLMLSRTPSGALHVTLIDLGVAHLLAAQQLTQAGVMIGTPHFMSPEQILGTPAVTPASDVFSLGVLLYELLARQRAYQGEDMIAVVAKIALQEPPRLCDAVPDAPADLDALLARAMSKRPQQRHADGHELGLALAGLTPLATQPSLPTSTAPVIDESTETLVASSPALISAERRVVSALFARLPQSTDAAATFARVARSFGGTPYRLLALAEVAVFGASQSFGDEALRAARAALAVRAVIPDARLALSTGRALTGGSELSGDVIDRGARVIEAADAAGVELDETTARLLGDRFDIEATADRMRIATERHPSGAYRILLGRATAFVGRDGEVALLERLYDEVAGGSGSRVALILGAGGAGKSRLANEVTRRLARGATPPAVLRARAASFGETSPLGVIAAMVRDVSRIRVDDPRAIREAKLRATVRDGEHTRLVPLLAEISSVGAADPARAEDAVLVSDRLREAFTAWLGNVVAVRPVLLVLEDLQLCDAASLALLDAALGNLRGLLVLGVGRPDALRSHPGLFAAHAPLVMSLPGLAPAAAASLVQTALGDAATDEIVRGVIERADGNAFFLEELIRSVAERLATPRAAVFESVPATVAGILQTRLDSLGFAAKRLIKAGSVFGGVTWLGGIAAVLGEAADDRDLVATVGELVHAEMLEVAGAPRFGGETELVFRHALLREAAYELLFDDDLVQSHRRAALWLESRGELDPLTMARHFEKGGLPERAAAHYLAAAEAALTGSDLDGAIASAERALSCGAAGDARGRVFLTLAEARRWQGDLEGALVAGEQAAALFRPGSRFWFGAIRERVAAHGRLGHQQAILPLGLQALGVAAEPDASGAQIAALVPAAVHLLYVGEGVSASQLSERIEALARRLPWLETLARARLCQLRAAFAVHGRDLERAAHEQDLARQAFELLGDTRAAALASCNLGFTLLELGVLERAEEVLRATLATARRLGLLTIEPLAMQNLGMVLARRGRFAEAAALQQDAAQRFEARKDPRLSGASRIHLALAHLAQGEVAAGRAEAEKVLAGGFEPLHVGARAALSMAHLRNGDADRALHEARAAMAILERLRFVEEFELTARLALAEALYARGNHDEAMRALAGARARLAEQVARLGDGALRRSFLERIPEHARVVALTGPLDVTGR